MSQSCKKNDLFGEKWVNISLRLLLGIAVILSITINISPIIETIMWSGVLFIHGIFCLINAYRCSRIHCYFTGPAFFVAAMLVILEGINIIKFRPNWLWIALIVLVLLGLHIVPEKISGKYKTK